MNNTVGQIRQGDVLLVPRAIPRSARPVAREKGRVVLAYGEVSGHAHAFTNPAVAMFLDSSFGRSNRYIEVKEPSALVHEEHSTIEVPAGTYRVVQQRQYDGLQDEAVYD